jgi:hypothetical protein
VGGGEDLRLAGGLSAAGGEVEAQGPYIYLAFLLLACILILIRAISG